MTRLTLSFDNGPVPGATGWILDLLAERGLFASFFLVANRLNDPQAWTLAERAHAEGHWIGNHTLTHTLPLGLDPDPRAPEREIGDAQALIGLLARAAPLFRPPGKGRLGPHLLSIAAANYLAGHKYTVVTWNCVPGDYEPPRGAWLERALGALHQRDWILMVLHDQHLDRGPLTRLLDAVRDGGIDIVQDFPPDCLPMRLGIAEPGFEDLVTASA
jgi:peptidoglycan-N-acetylglucosamine deacetylase